MITLWDWQVLKITARTIGGPAYQEMIEEMDRELNNIIGDFDRAVNVEALGIANETSKLSFFTIVDSRSSGVWCRAGAGRARANRARASGDQAS